MSGTTVTTKTHSFRKIPLRFVLIFPFVVQIVFAVGLTGWLSVQNGQQAVNDVANQLRAEITERVRSYVQTYADIPFLVLDMNAAAINTGNLNPEDLEGLERLFWEQTQLNPSATTIYYGGANGHFLLVTQELGDLPQVMIRDDESGDMMNIYHLGEQGERVELFDTVSYDPRERPWYQIVLTTQTHSWSPIYVFATEPDLGITPAVPIYDENQTFLGVIAVDFTVSQLSNFLKNLDIGENGHVFIMEQSGDIVASSTDEEPFILSESGERERLAVLQSREPLIRDTAQYLKEYFGDFTAIDTTHQLEFDIYGNRQFLQVTPFQDGQGLEWLIVVVVPEDAFMGQINQNTSLTILLMFIALIFTTIIGVFTAQWLIRPILTLNEAAKSLAQGEWRTIPVERADELGELTTSFNRMAEQLHEAFDKLEYRVRDRTKQLETVAFLSGYFNTILDFDKLLDEIVQQIQQRFEYYYTSIFILDEAGKNLVMQAHVGKNSFDTKILSIPLHATTSLIAGAARTGEVISVANVHEREDWLQDSSLPDTASEMVIPIIWKGRVVGVLDVQQSTIAGFDEGDANLLRSLANQIAIAMQNARLYSLTQKANQELRQLNADKDRFFSIVAHDLKGPFMPVLGNAELLSEMGDTLPPTEIKAMGRSIHRSVRNVYTLLENLLDWARLQMGRMEYQAVPLQLREIARKNVDLFAANAELKGVALHNEVAVTAWVEADANMVDTIIRNLTSNALKFTEAGGSITINARLLETGFVEVAIADTGVGMTADVCQKLFQLTENVSTLGTAEEQGTGLGLIICQEMVQKWGGAIGVESQLGQGTTVKFTVRHLPPR